MSDEKKTPHEKTPEEVLRDALEEKGLTHVVVVGQVTGKGVMVGWSHMDKGALCFLSKCLDLTIFDVLGRERGEPPDAPTE